MRRKRFYRTCDPTGGNVYYYDNLKQFHDFLNDSRKIVKLVVMITKKEPCGWQEIEKTTCYIDKKTGKYHVYQEWQRKVRHGWYGDRYNYETDDKQEANDFFRNIIDVAKDCGKEIKKLYQK